MPTTLVELKHGYDLAGNRLYRYDQVARDLSKSFDELYGYDDLNRLTAFDRGQLGMGNDSITGPTLSQSWSLDPQGNWKGFTQSAVNALTQTREHNEANEITDISKSVGADWPTPTYGTHKNGNTLTFPNPRSLTAELSGTYDAWNRLVKLEGGPTVAEYQYDGMNRRIIKDADSVTRHFYHSDQWQVLEERTDSNTSADRQYVWGQRYVDDLVLRDHDSTRLYALSDALFNVVALTDDDGAVVERFAYRAYGESLELDPDFDQPYTGTDYEWEYRFTGRELDLESGLQLNRNRYLHLQLGRWMTRDPVGYSGSKWNLYEYARSDPTYDRDSSGLSSAGEGHFGYGNFCGPGRKAKCIGTTPAPFPTNPTPIDGLDSACMFHDCCLATATQVILQCIGLTNCNAGFCKVIKAFNCDTTYPQDDEKRYECHVMQKNAIFAFCN